MSLLRLRSPSAPSLAGAPALCRLALASALAGYGFFDGFGERPAAVRASSGRRRTGALASSLFLSAAALLAGCSFVEDFDSLRGSKREPRVEILEATAGGGRSDSPSYRLELTVGLPQPMGVVESPRHRLRLGSTSR